MNKNKLTIASMMKLLFSLLALGLITSLTPFAQAAATTVFIDEIHYDNASVDTGEAIEIAGPAGTDLSGWSIVLYNGNGGAPYGTTNNLSGTIPDQQNGFGTISFSYPSNGLQNGAPDGVALVDSSSNVVQFLSYEGSFTAVGGPADGMASTDIGVAEDGSTPAGDSLQLIGTGTIYEDFTWNTPVANTFGAVNTGQTFSGSSDTAPFVSSIAPANGATDVAVDANIDVNFSEDVAVGAWYDITCTSSGNHTATVSGGPQNYTLDPDVDFANSETCTVTILAAQIADTDTDDPPDNMAANYVFSFDTTSGAVTPDIIINEVDADQTGTDSAEFVELYDGGVGNTDLTGLVLVFFNGNGDKSYRAFDLDGQSTDGDGYFVLCGDAGNVANCDLDVSPDTGLIQNGADAVALYVGDGTNFPNNTPLTTVNLIDAIVYDTNDGDDGGLLPLLDAGQPQVNEDGNNDKDNHSNQRCSNGSGGARNTDTYAQFAPTPGAANACGLTTGTIIVEKQTDPDGATDSFDFTGNAAGTIKDGEQIVVSGLQPGTYTSQETVPAGWGLDAIECGDDNSSGDVNTGTATFQLEAGEAVKCIFYNEEEEPTAITLASFAVEANDGRVMILWETGTEIDNAGFNIYRAPSPDGPWFKINSALIVAEGDPVSGGSYTFVDTPGRGAFYYRLEDVDYFGLSTLHSPVLAELGSAIRAPWFRPAMPEF